jgi:hypothetical protein
MTVSAVMPTSADPRAASQNFTAERLAAMVPFSGRLVAPLSRHPDEQEIAILTGTLLLSVRTVAVPRTRQAVNTTDPSESPFTLELCSDPRATVKVVQRLDGTTDAANCLSHCR